MMFTFMIFTAIIIWSLCVPINGASTNKFTIDDIETKTEFNFRKEFKNEKENLYIRYENKPIDETFKANVIEAYAEEKAHRKRELVKLGALERDLALAEETIVPLSCARLFRYRMDIFGIEFGHPGNQRGKDCPSFKTALNAIEGVLHKRKLNLCYAVQELIELYQNFSGKGNTFSNFSPLELSIWESKAKYACNRIRSVSLPGNQIEKILPKYDILINLIRHIHSAKNEDEALEIFKNHCVFKFWSRIKFNAFDDNPEIEKLVYELPAQERCNLIDDLNKRTKGYLEPEDRKFFHDYIEYGGVSYYLKNNKHYQGCLEVFYYAVPDSIKPLNDDLERKWKTFPFPLRVVKFCTAYAQLYDLLSVSNVHSPSDNTVFECKVGSKDIKNFFDRLTATDYHKDDFIIVAEVFGMIKE